MTPPSNRIKWLDMARGYAILLVIIGHFNFEGLTIPIYSFHMPLFFFLAGYTYSTKGKFFVFLNNIIRKLVIPYIFLCIPVILTNLLLTKSWSLHVFFDQCCLFIHQQRYTTLWFLPCLIVLRLFFFPIISYCSNNLSWAISITLGICGLLLWRYNVSPFIWNADLALVVAPFFYAGYRLKHKDSFAQKINLIKSQFTILFSLFTGLLLICFSYFNYALSGSVVNLFCSVFKEEWLSYVTAFIGIAFIIVLSIKHTISAISYIGKNSLIYFAWHQTVIIPLLYSFYFKLGLHSVGYLEIILPLISILITLVILTIANEVICHSKLKIALGK